MLLFPLHKIKDTNNKYVIKRVDREGREGGSKYKGGVCMCVCVCVWQACGVCVVKAYIEGKGRKGRKGRAGGSEGRRSSVRKCKMDGEENQSVI